MRQVWAIKIPLTVVVPSGQQHYSCSACGDCCRGKFAVIATDTDRQRILGQGWSDNELQLNGKPLFVARAHEFQVAHKDDGTCVFLADNNRCLIHAKFGLEAKPVSCRMYPFRFIPMGDKVRVDVRFDCPSVAGDKGVPISKYRKELQDIVRTMVPDGHAEIGPVPFFDNVSLTWSQLSRVTEAFEQLLSDISLDITRRVAACVNLSWHLREPRITSLTDGELGDYLDELVGDAQVAAATDDLEHQALPSSERSIFRQVVGFYGTIDTVGQRSQIMRKLGISMRLMSGKGLVPQFFEDFPRVTFQQVDDARGVPSGGAALAIERYLVTHLNCMGFFGPSFYNRKYLDGLNSLLLTFPLICWFMRCFTAVSGRTQTDQQCSESALQIVDHQHGVTPQLDFPLERSRTRLLCQAETLRSLVVWYGS